MFFLKQPTISKLSKQALYCQESPRGRYNVHLGCNMECRLLSTLIRVQRCASAIMGSDNINDKNLKIINHKY